MNKRTDLTAEVISRQGQELRQNNLVYHFRFSGAASLLIAFLCALSDLRGEQKKTDLTAEIAENAEVTSAIAGHKDIFFSFSFSGAASLILAFLCDLRGLCGEQK